MKVTNSPSGVPAQIESTRAAEKTSKSNAAQSGKKAAVSSGSQVEISERAQLMNKAAETAKGAPDVRRDRVEALKAQILNGTYRIDSESVAEKLLQEHLDTDFGKNNL